MLSKRKNKKEKTKILSKIKKFVDFELDYYFPQRKKRKPVRNRISKVIRSSKKHQKKDGQPIFLSVIGHEKSVYALSFSSKNKRIELMDLKSQGKALARASFNKKSKIKNAQDWKYILFSKTRQGFLLTYKAKTKKKSGYQIGSWHSEDFLHWNYFETSEFPEPFLVVGGYQYDKKEVAYFKKGKKVFYHLLDRNNISGKARETDLQIDSRGFEEKGIYPARVFLKKEGILLLYYGYDKKGDLGIGAALFNKNNPAQVLWKTTTPIWHSSKFQESKYQPLGIIKKKTGYEFYCKNKREELFCVALPKIICESALFSSEESNEYRVEYGESLGLKKNKKNPILTPQQQNHWEASGSFNPAAVCLEDKVHLVYRAVGHDGMSVLGYASSDNGSKISERSPKPVYMPSQPFELIKDNQSTFRYPYMSGGGWGGCEDPRLSVVEDRIFMTYTAFNGHQAPGVALTSIKINDFLNKKWRWKKPRLISEPGKINKNWVVFPEKINGKYAILHSISPSILVDYFDSLEQKDMIIKSHHERQADGKGWENIIRGVGAPPIKTEHGWLVFYHAMDKQHPDRYKLGVMLLDYHDPQKIINRYHSPILEPSECYENDGKPGVVYACGAVLKRNKLFVYYGGADKVTCVATASLNEVINALCRQPQKVFEFVG